MFKQAIIATAVLAASTGLAFANGGTYAAPAPCCVHSCYVGVAVSRDFFNVDTNTGYFGNADAGNDGWNGDLNVGFGYVIQDHYYLGAEVFGDVNSTTIDLGNVINPVTGAVVGTASLKNRYDLGIDFVPGVKISDSTMLYGKVGYVNGNFSGFSNTFGSSSNSKNLSGLQLGLGLKTMITNNVSANLEYDYNYYSKFNQNVISTANTGIISSRPTVDQVKLGVAYNFMSA